MTILEKFNSGAKLTKAEKIANDILQDLENRCGLGDELEMISKSIKEEMLSEWIRLIELSEENYKSK